MLDRRIDRHAFLGLSAAAVLTACSGGGNGGSSKPSVLPAVPKFASDPFTLGVASGDPTADGVVLWTRLAPDPLVGGGMPPVGVPVRWMIGDDDELRKVVDEGVVITGPDRAHAVHAVVEGLEPDRPYWYRFDVGGYETPIARTRTFPKADASPDSLRFAFASCQNYREGYFTAWGDVVADEDLDLVVFLGDYIYEYGFKGQVRDHDVREVITLEQYRNRHALYRRDPLLQAAHTIAPWIVTLDDHDVDNNYQGDAPEALSNTRDPQEFLARRAAAYRAWWEHMPTRLPAPTGPDFPNYRRQDFGGLARFHVLDTRQYRTAQPCRSALDIGPLCDAAKEPDLTVLGTEQERWFEEGLTGSDATWNIIAQQVVFSQIAFTKNTDGIRSLDSWDGYPQARRHVVEMLQRDDVANPVVITGDVHQSYVADVTANFDDPDAAVLGTELVGTSISAFKPAAFNLLVDEVIDINPHVKWGDASKRGWVRCELTRDEWRADFRVVEDATVEGSPMSTNTSWVIERDGRVERA